MRPCAHRALPGGTAGVTQGRHGFQGCWLPPPRGPHPGASSPMVHRQFCLPQQRHVIAAPGIQSASLNSPWLQPGNFQTGSGSPGGPRQHLGDPAYQPPRDDPLLSLLYRIPPSPPSSSIWLIKQIASGPQTADAVWRVTRFYSGRGTDMVFI